MLALLTLLEAEQREQQERQRLQELEQFNIPYDYYRGVDDGEWLDGEAEPAIDYYPTVAQQNSFPVGKLIYKDPYTGINSHQNKFQSKRFMVSKKKRSNNKNWFNGPDFMASPNGDYGNFAVGADGLPKNHKAQ